MIGRGGSNINAIRGATGAHIEVEKQSKGQGERIITIKGSAEATKQAHSLIGTLIKDPDVDILSMLPKTTKTVITSSLWDKTNAAVSLQFAFLFVFISYKWMISVGSQKERETYESPAHNPSPNEIAEHKHLIEQHSPDHIHGNETVHNVRAPYYAWHRPPTGCGRREARRRTTCLQHEEHHVVHKRHNDGGTWLQHTIYRQQQQQ